MKISAEPVLALENGRAIWLTAEAGEVPALHTTQTPEGNKTVLLPDSFPVGALMLTDANGASIVGPVGYDQVMDYARLVLADDPRIRTRSGVTLMLAAALLALDRERKGQ